MHLVALNTLTHWRICTRFVCPTNLAYPWQLCLFARQIWALLDNFDFLGSQTTLATLRNIPQFLERGTIHLQEHSGFSEVDGLDIMFYIHNVFVRWWGGGDGRVVDFAWCVCINTTFYFGICTRMPKNWIIIIIIMCNCSAKAYSPTFLSTHHYAFKHPGIKEE
jgi:hypothetical protein